VHRRSAGLFGEPADHLRSGRLRRRRAIADRAHRCERIGGRARCAGRDDVPQAVHERRHPQLLLESPTGPRSWLMGSHGIRDRVAIVSVGCTPFGEHWDRSVDDLMVQAVDETLAVVGLRKQDIDAYWLGSAQRSCGITLAKPLELEGKPVSRVENFCATGSEALRQASYAVASGAYDIAMAVGVEKL